MQYSQEILDYIEVRISGMTSTEAINLFKTSLDDEMLSVIRHAEDSPIIRDKINAGRRKRGIEEVEMGGLARHTLIATMDDNLASIGALVRRKMEDVSDPSAAMKDLMQYQKEVRETFKLLHHHQEPMIQQTVNVSQSDTPKGRILEHVDAAFIQDDTPMLTEEQINKLNLEQIDELLKTRRRIEKQPAWIAAQEEISPIWSSDVD
jgi:hypothetical protein